jgi:murein DD-endopeptidase MepM/ murein hydrolase activator NlpD
MPQLSAFQSQHMARAQRVTRAAVRRVDARLPEPGKPGGAAAYTFAHRGRQFRLGPVAFWIVVGSVVIMAAWSGVTATYFAFRDDVLKHFMARQTEQQNAYEDRIAELRAQIDRSASRQLLDHEQFDQKLDELLHREATLELRSTALNGIGDAMTTGSIKPASRGADQAISPHRLGRGTQLEPWRQPANASTGKQADIGAKLLSIETSFDRIEQRQSAAVAQMQDRYDGEVRKVRGVFAELGLRPDAPSGGSGGPFVPVKLPPETQTFQRALVLASIARAEAEQLDTALTYLPVRVPVTGEIEITSPFGVRIDPFVHQAAMHTGLDFRGAFGEPIHATAAGTITNAGWSGGYGKMVEINHGNGLATRYGHLSEIDVAVGQTVRIGQVIGRLGSTGRSTGPHLHYETRIDGEAVDPAKFLNAGARLFGEQQAIRPSQRGEVQD